MNQADTLCHRPNSAVRNLCLRAIHDSSLKFQPSSAPLSSQTPTLPVPRRAGDAIREKQIPFRQMKTLLSMIACSFLSVSVHAESFMTRTLDSGSGGITGKHTSQAIIANNPAIAYFNETDSSLMFARSSTPGGSGSWSTTTVQSFDYVGQYPSLAQVNGFPAISYFDNTNGVFKYVRALDANGANWGTPVTLDRATNVWQDSSLVVVNGNPAVCYYGNTNDGNTNGILKYIRATDVDGTIWSSPQIIDGVRGAGTFPSMAVINEDPAVSYYSGGSLFFVRALDSIGASWGEPIRLEIAPMIGTGGKTSLVAVNGNPAIAYIRWLQNNHLGLGFVRALDANGTIWSPSMTLDDSSDQVGLYASMAVIDGNPAISYYDHINRDLKYMRASDSNGATWGSRVTLDYNGEVGSFTSLSAIDGSAAISYCNLTNGSLKWASDARTLNALKVETPLLKKDPITGQFKLTIGVHKSTNLKDFVPFPMTAPQTIINAEGKLEFLFAVPESAAFFRLQAQ